MTLRIRYRVRAFGKYASKHSFPGLGSIAETKHVLEFCAEHNIGPDMEIIDIGDVNDAYRKVDKGDVRFRYVIAMSTLK